MNSSSFLKCRTGYNNEGNLHESNMFGFDFRGNKPRWMAAGLLLIALSLVLCFVMNIIFPPPELEAHQIFGALENNSDRMVCTLSNGSGNSNESSLQSASLRSKSLCTIDPVRRNWAFAAWVFIYSIMGEGRFAVIHHGSCSLDTSFLSLSCFEQGVGGTTVYVIGAPYLDDSISKKESPFYFSACTGITIKNTFTNNCIIA